MCGRRANLTLDTTVLYIHIVGRFDRPPDWFHGLASSIKARGSEKKS
jgi:hypothetical protein